MQNRLPVLILHQRAGADKWRFRAIRETGFLNRYSFLQKGDFKMSVDYKCRQIYNDVIHDVTKTEETCVFHL